MKKLFITLTIALCSLASFAQQSAYTKGSNVVQLGLGIGATFYGTSIGSSSTSIPPVFGSYEYGFTDRISAGAILGYASHKYNFDNSSYVKYSYVLAAARGNYHFFFIDSKKWDPYAGVTLGYNSVTSSVSGNESGYTATGSSVLLGLQAGARYYFTPSIGAFAEVGYGISVLGLGVTFKF